MGTRLAELSQTLRDLLVHQQNVAPSRAAQPQSSMQQVALEDGAHGSEESAGEAAPATAAMPQPSMQQTVPVIVHGPPQPQKAAVPIRAEVIAVASPLPDHDPSSR